MTPAPDATTEPDDSTDPPVSSSSADALADDSLDDVAGGMYLPRVIAP